MHETPGNQDCCISLLPPICDFNVIAIVTHLLLGCLVSVPTHFDLITDAVARICHTPQLFKLDSPVITGRTLNLQKHRINSIELNQL